ncbi:Serine/threonine protein phosphatase PrpC [Tindallia magadiensis]|uniref:Serine/threonine protein phosphatase PrpC n=1 Tax=Tindallia magadiensis TaxID=69895 RepID=A0A1I3ERM5_9FIRM|nr:protein phosphatase 2C domain-containing protein [Tindallia magadiensis]SFI01619.1 Serine/threonine protein phosphatase PrpC [Tindallia magadiensis]
MKILHATISKTGGRKRNEDYCGCYAKDGLLCAVLADGLGGHRGGEKASRTVVQSVLEDFGDHPDCSAEGLHRYFIRANKRLAEGQVYEPHLAGMKTTLVIWAGNHQRGIWGHIGDSRLYHFRGGKMISCTKDHSLPQKLADIGEIDPSEIRHHEDRNRLTAVMDGSESMKWQILEKPVELERRDALLLCTDGFWEYLDEEEMEESFRNSSDPQEWLEIMEDKIRERAPKDQDNYTAIALTVK